jgi:hypothetical protein
VHVRDTCACVEKALQSERAVRELIIEEIARLPPSPYRYFVACVVCTLQTT